MWTVICRIVCLTVVYMSGTLSSDGRHSTQCVEERRQALVSNSGSRVRSPGVYVPECLDDGAFSPVQCHQAAGYCWCVTPDGRPIPETSVQGTDVKCKERGLGYQRDGVQRGSKTRRGVRTKSCDQGDRKEFNKNLVQIFSEEYNRDPTLEKGRPGVDHVILWKFDQLDEDDDEFLRRADVRTLKKMLKKVVKPRKCAKTFDSYCDLNGDRRMSREEWLWCLGGDISRIKSGRGSKVCTPTDRAKFNSQLIQSFISEFAVTDPVHTSTQTQGTWQNTPSPDEALDTRERQVMALKFTQLDRDHDGRLRRDEIRPLKAQVKATMKPKSCAKTLDTHCDLNGDEFIMVSEWSLCLGLDMNNAPTGGGTLHGDLDLGHSVGDSHGNSQKSPLHILTSGPKLSSHTSKDEDLHQIVSDQESRHTTPSHEESILDSGCIKARHHFLQEHRADPRAHIFVPECQENGHYRREQCHNSTGFCWCVDEITGKSIPTTSTRNVMPNCTNVKIREFKGCSYLKLKEFLTKLLDKVTTEMMEFANNASDKSPVLDNNPDLTLEEQAVRWKLRMLDKNNNQRLERQELKHFKNVVRMKKDLRKCSRNFLRYCDESQDGSISLTEWIECTGIHEQQRNLPEHDTSKRINPFITYLKGAQ